jgi:hypothetical protein
MLGTIPKKINERQQEENYGIGEETVMVKHL